MQAIESSQLAFKLFPAIVKPKISCVQKKCTFDNYVRSLTKFMKTTLGQPFCGDIDVIHPQIIMSFSVFLLK